MRPSRFMLLMLLTVGVCDGCHSSCGPGGIACVDPPKGAVPARRDEDPAEKHKKPPPKDVPADDARAKNKPSRKT